MGHRDIGLSEIDEKLAGIVKPVRGSSKRKEKVASGKTPTPKAGYVQDTFKRLHAAFQPTDKQKVFINKVKSNRVTFCDSVAGTGKTSAALYSFCEDYLTDPSINIVITRTPVEVGGDKVGFLPDGLDQKLEVHFASAKKILEQMLGKEKVAADLGKRIHFTIPNYLLGATMENVRWLIDETQQLQPIILKLLLERIGLNTNVVVAGCSSQIYTTDKNRNALADGVNRFFDNNKETKYDQFAFHEFDIDDVMRDDIVKSVIRAYM